MPTHDAKRTRAHARPPPSACPGAQLAQSILFIFASTVLSVFDIEKVVINGVVQEPKNDFSSGVLVYVRPLFFPFSSRCFATQLERFCDIQPSEALPEPAQAALLEGRVPRSFARPPRILDSLNPSIHPSIPSHVRHETRTFSILIDGMCGVGGGNL
jgi:hypothetical protein